MWGYFWGYVISLVVNLFNKNNVFCVVIYSYYRTIIYTTSRDVQQKCLVPYFCHFLPEMSQFDRVLKKRMELKWVYLHCHFLLQ